MRLDRILRRTEETLDPDIMFNWFKRNGTQGAKGAPHQNNTGIQNSVAANQLSSSEADIKAAAEAAKNRGNDFLNAGDLKQAAGCYQEALRIWPSYAEGCVNLGVVFELQKRYAEAEGVLLNAIAINASLWQAHLHLGIVLHEQHRYGEAIESYQKAVAQKADYAECHWRLGISFLEKKNYQQAIDSFECALALDPDLSEIQTNLGTAFVGMHRFEEALDHYRQSLKVREHHVTHFLAGFACELLLLRQQALEHYQRALVLAPDYFPAHYHIAFILLLLGDYEEGLAHFEKRLLLQDEMEWLKPIKEVISGFGIERYWRGNSLEGKQLVVLTEQGLGDTLMMLRYLPLIKETKRAMKLHVVCDAPLARLVRNLPSVDEVTIKPANLRSDSFDFYCTTMSLPSLFEARLENIPSAPYLHIPEQEKLRWAQRLSSERGLKVGIAWAGNPKLGTDAIRSIPLRKLRPLMTLSGITWINLQKNDASEQMKETEWSMLDWMSECQDLQDTGALMENLDLIITVDTAVVHLAGSLGRPTWLLNRYESEWRWMLNREDSPWYHSVRIFRQPMPNDWDSVIGRVAVELITLTTAVRLN